MYPEGIKRFFELIHKRGPTYALTTAYIYIVNRLNIVIKKALPDSYCAKWQMYNIKKETDYSIVVNYDKIGGNAHADLCDRYGTDKGEVTSKSNPYPWPSHNYSDFYEQIFASKRNDVNTVLECGIGSDDTTIRANMGSEAAIGASLRVWRDYFPNAQIVGIDIDKNAMFSEERIDTYCVDQTSADSIKQFLSETGIEKFDVIIDDGLHKFSANKSLFEHTADYLSHNGVYIIEDISYYNLEKYRDYFFKELEDFNVRMIDMETPERPFPCKYNRMIMITPK